MKLGAVMPLNFPIVRCKNSGQVSGLRLFAGLPLLTTSLFLGTRLRHISSTQAPRSPAEHALMLCRPR